MIESTWKEVGGRWSDRGEEEGKETRRGDKGGSIRGRDTVREERAADNTKESKGEVRKTLLTLY